MFGFRKFIAPAVIKFLYYVGVVVTIFGGLGVATYAFVEMKSLGAPEAMKMLGAAAIGTPLLLAAIRFSAEMWLVLFEINERLGQIRDKR